MNFLSILVIIIKNETLDKNVTLFYAKDTL